MSEDRWAVIACADQEVGRIAALALGRAGYCVALIGPDQTVLDSLADAVQSVGAPQSLVFATSLAKLDELEGSVDLVLSLTGGVDALVHVIGKASEDSDRLSACLLAPIRLTELLSAGMVERAAGRVLIAVEEETSPSPASTAARSGLAAWVGAIAETLGSQGIAVLLVRYGASLDDASKRALSGAFDLSLDSAAGALREVVIGAPP